VGDDEKRNKGGGEEDRGWPGHARAGTATWSDEVDPPHHELVGNGRDIVAALLYGDVAETGRREERLQSVTREPMIVVGDVMHARRPRHR